jgi:hypothetical protein
METCRKLRSQKTVPDSEEGIKIMENELTRMEGLNDTKNGEETEQGENLPCG